MKISCVLDTGQLGTRTSDLIVFPEGIDQKQIDQASSTHPDSIIVGAILENGRSHGVLLHQGRNRIDYWKVGRDGRTEGSGNFQQMPVYELSDVCIGVLICMDADSNPLSRVVIERVKSSDSGLKLICVPADMASHWFPDGIRWTQFEGVHLIVCNHTKTYQESARCRSFITDTHGRKVVVQKDDEPIHAQLPLAGPIAR